LGRHSTCVAQSSECLAWTHFLEKGSDQTFISEMRIDDSVSNILSQKPVTKKVITRITCGKVSVPWEKPSRCQIYHIFILLTVFYTILFKILSNHIRSYRILFKILQILFKILKAPIGSHP